MTVVVDANLFVCLVLDDRRSEAVARRLRLWRDEDRQMHAPSLFPYEVASGLTRSLTVGELDLADVGTAWQRVANFPIHLHDLHDGESVIEIARRLGRKSAYDAAYVALAQELDADLWTLDGPLSRNATGAGLPVRLIETP